jgi:uncharacterized membrane protein YjgN (DUF898 family)
VQAAGSLFFALIDSFNHTKSMHPDAGLKMMSVMVTIISFFHQGFRYLAGILSSHSVRLEFTIGCCKMFCMSIGKRHDTMDIWCRRKFNFYIFWCSL